MHAVGIKALGGPEQLKLMEVEEPRPGRFDVVIRVAAASVNRLDLEFSRNGGPDDQPAFPAILGCDGSGVISSVGVLAIGFHVGDPVIFAACPMTAGHGAYAEYVAVPSNQVALKAPGLDWAMAAAMPLAALAACQAVDRLMPEPGETVLVNGASGGVGSFAVQLIRMRGARVIANARVSAWPACRELGAEDCVDGRSEDLVPALHAILPSGVDAVLDLVDGATQVDSSGGMRRGSRLVTLLSVHQKPVFKDRRVTAWSMHAKPNTPELSGLSRLLDAGRLLMPKVERFAMGEAAEAHARLDAGGVLGKLVLMTRGFLQ